MRSSIAALTLITMLLHRGIQAWTTIFSSERIRTSSHRLGHCVQRMAASHNNEEESVYMYTFTTKTKKKVVYDDKTARFYETSLDPDEQAEEYTGDSSKSSIFSPEFEETLQSDPSSNEMVPTKFMFANSKFLSETEEDVASDPLSDQVVEEVNKSSRDNSKTSYPHADVIVDLLESDYASVSSDSDGTSRQEHARKTTMSLVEQCYEAWNRRDMDQVVACFSDSFQYDDTQYSGLFVTKRELLHHLDKQARLLPPESKIILESIACDEASGKIATQWHLESNVNGRNQVVPYTRGCSFYTVDRASGQIRTGMRVSEMLVKPSEDVVRSIVQSASSVMNSFGSNTFVDKERSTDSPTDKEMENQASSIIERYFEAWNKRDIAKALEYFVEDCTYQTEDPLFVSTMQGKAKLKEHLESNAAVLPGTCRIVLDDIAIDRENGRIGTMWHLELAKDVPVPNLRGCSMYTTDLDSGLLVTGYDVTESPFKIPRSAVGSLELPARILFGV